jgi:hypothetical protein
MALSEAEDLRALRQASWHSPLLPLEQHGRTGSKNKSLSITMHSKMYKVFQKSLDSVLNSKGILLIFSYLSLWCASHFSALCMGVAWVRLRTHWRRSGETSGSQTWLRRFRIPERRFSCGLSRRRLRQAVMQSGRELWPQQPSNSWNVRSINLAKCLKYFHRNTSYSVQCTLNCSVYA